MNDSAGTHLATHPFPPRDPADEAKRLVTGSPSHLLELDHHVFAGARDFAKPFLALVAGGGTGDATVMLAQQLADAGEGGMVVHLDPSPASAEIAEARVRARGLANVRFVRGTIGTLPTLQLGTFDYIDCCGILQHLEKPGEGLKALHDALADDGGMGMTVPAPLGRTGVYHAQAMLRLMLGAETPDSVRIETARRLVNALPETNWLKRNEFVGDYLKLGDAGLYDLLLHPRDRAFSVVELADLLRQGGMRPVNFADPARYEPALYVRDPDLLERIRQLNWVQRCAFAELLAGNMKAHVLYAVKDSNTGNTIAVPDTPECVPVLRDIEGARLAEQLRPGMGIGLEGDGLKLTLPLPPTAKDIIARIDNRRSLAAIHADLSAGMDNPPDWARFKQNFDAVFTTLYGVGRMFIRKPPAAA